MIHKKGTLRVIYLLAFSLLCVLQTTAQQQIIGNSGGNIRSEYGSLSWTIGEPVIKTIKGNNCFLTQGFHQSNLIITEIEDSPSLSYKINAYPNPVSTTLIIHIDNPNIPNMSFSIISSSGSVVKSGQIYDFNTSVPVQELVASIYFLKIYDKNKSVKTFKIVKH